MYDRVQKIAEEVEENGIVVQGKIVKDAEAISRYMQAAKLKSEGYTYKTIAEKLSEKEDGSPISIKRAHDLVQAGLSIYRDYLYETDIDADILHELGLDYIFRHAMLRAKQPGSSPQWYKIALDVLKEKRRKMDTSETPTVHLDMRSLIREKDKLQLELKKEEGSDEK
jgi:hypothetical protein